MKDFKDKLKEALMDDEPEMEVKAEDAPKKVKFKKKLVRKKKPKEAAANEQARAALKGPTPNG